MYWWRSSVCFDAYDAAISVSWRGTGVLMLLCSQAGQAQAEPDCDASKYAGCTNPLEPSSRFTMYHDDEFAVISSSSTSVNYQAKMLLPEKNYTLEGGP